MIGTTRRAVSPTEPVRANGRWLRIASVTGLAFLAGLPTGCKTIYYKTMESMGYPKRELLVERVEEARDSQNEAKEQFRSALEEFASVVNFDGGELEEKYERLNDQFESSEAKAERVGKRIAAVEDVAGALFAEWEDELEDYSSDNLRRSSEQKLEQTRERYEQLIAAMRRAESKIEPVLSSFRDQVLFLKHNLNAKAIASLRDELVSVETDVSELIREMEAAVEEANDFISEVTEDDVEA